MPGSDISAEPFFWMTSQRRKRAAWRFSSEEIFRAEKCAGRKQMEKALQSSRFCNFTWEEILELYTGRALLVKKEEKQRRTAKRILVSKYSASIKKSGFSKLDF